MFNLNIKQYNNDNVAKNSIDGNRLKKKKSNYGRGNDQHNSK